ncbi:homeodomain-like superfamily protein [Striga asiatica]|uniref:Homeodomain-like superfamily protein n=1 Tax=Striga asiatica TaxID=4170 RepID=A0A5A7Q2D4_STRAF|nr:homeodomain-like superfamily protein [Striga asiatica]
MVELPDGTLARDKRELPANQNCPPPYSGHACKPVIVATSNGGRHQSKGNSGRKASSKSRGWRSTSYHPPSIPELQQLAEATQIGEPASSSAEVRQLVDHLSEQAREASTLMDLTLFTFSRSLYYITSNRSDGSEFKEVNWRDTRLSHLRHSRRSKLQTRKKLRALALVPIPEPGLRSDLPSPLDLDLRTYRLLMPNTCLAFSISTSAKAVACSVKELLRRDRWDRREGKFFRLSDFPSTMPEMFSDAQRSGVELSM